MEAILRFCGGYTKSDQLLCHSQLKLRLSRAVAISFKKNCKLMVVLSFILFLIYPKEKISGRSINVNITEKVVPIEYWVYLLTNEHIGDMFDTITRHRDVLAVALWLQEI